MQLHPKYRNVHVSLSTQNIMPWKFSQIFGHLYSPKSVSLHDSNKDVYFNSGEKLHIIGVLHKRFSCCSCLKATYNLSCLWHCLFLLIKNIFFSKIFKKMIPRFVYRLLTQKKTRSIQRTQTPQRLRPLTLTFDLDLTTRSRKLMSLDVTYYIVPWFQVWCLWM